MDKFSFHRLQNDEKTHLFSTGDSTLEMNQSECEELWDPLTFLEAFCAHGVKLRNNIMVEQLSFNHTAEMTDIALLNMACK